MSKSGAPPFFNLNGEGSITFIGNGLAKISGQTPGLMHIQGTGRAFRRDTLNQWLFEICRMLDRGGKRIGKDTLLIKIAKKQIVNEMLMELSREGMVAIGKLEYETCAFLTQKGSDLFHMEEL